MKTGTFPLRLPLSLKAAIAKMAAQEGISMNQFLVLAAAEKLAEMRTAEHFFAERRGQGDVEAAIAFLQRPGGEPSREATSIRLGTAPDAAPIRSGQQQKHHRPRTQSRPGAVG